MTVNPADRPKVIALVSLIVVFFAFAIFRFMGAKSNVPTPPDITKPSAEASLPSTTQIASGQIVQNNPKAVAENLHEVFGVTNEIGPSENPFRMPVPPAAPNQQGNSTNSGPSTPNPTNSGPPTTMKGELPVVVNPGSVENSGPQVVAISDIQVKGIIAPNDGSEPLAFIKVGEKSKGYRVGEEVAPSVRVTAIDSLRVTLKIGASTIRAGVGEQVKPSQLVSSR